MSTSRSIFKSATSAPEAARNALAAVFAGEMLAPSKTVHLLAPWISNIVIFDNSVGSFSGLNPEWSRREIRLVDVLVAIASNDTRLVIRVRAENHNKPFKKRLFSALADSGLQDKCDWMTSDTLHTKSLLTDHVLIAGSMNFTERGISLNEEHVTLEFDTVRIAQAKMEFQDHGI
ncbi:phospholipase D-like domain-containing protein DpdK [Paraburkholderia terrae]|uniref:phospholipase D-like domain-containing protein DpdK n=1 Tax=Paraburkholderia terrae TaxID=311230 RepID=UPI001EE338DA|nr:phospholipase D-like domain-containing protein DpdK [Paraburkholderia terrae]GJG99174.1 hypothetical protein CBA19C8_01480 [Paraburkholderia terrae]